MNHVATIRRVPASCGRWSPSRWWPLTNLDRIRHRLPATVDRAVGAAGRNHSAILAGWLLIVAVLVTVTPWRF